MRDQKEKRNTRESLFLLKKKQQVIINRILVDKSLSDSLPDGNEEYLTKTGEKTIHVIKWQRTWLNCLHALMFYGR